MENRPPPPPHGTSSNSKSSNLPPGNYDIFVIPPHSSGSGFLYLPSLQTHRNSFLAGVACTLVVVGVWLVVVPTLKEWASAVAASGGIGVLLLISAIGVVGWAVGKTQSENSGEGQNKGTSANQQQSTGSTPSSPPPPGGASFANGARTNWQRPNTGPTTGWEKAREETRKREEERRKKEEMEKEKVKAREREIREKIAREKLAQERKKREAEAEAKLKGQTPQAGMGNYQKPTAQSYAGDDDRSFKANQNAKGPTKHSSQSSMHSESSWAASQSTTPTTPPPSNRAPYTNKDEEKIIIKAVYLLNNQYPKPVAQLISGVGKITDGLILKMTTEGLFVDDDVRGVPQREWDVKAWTLKLLESGELKGKHVMRASVRDADDKKYIYIIEEPEAWKVARGLQRLRRGSQVRSLGVSGIPANETKAILTSLGWT